jgi:acetoacetate decarboxylase
MIDAPLSPEIADNTPVHSPLYSSPVLYDCPNFKMLSVVCQTDELVIRKLLSYSPFEFVTNKFILYVADMQECTLGPFNDAGIIVPAKFRGTVGGYVAYEYITTDVGLAAGREPWGYPKKIAQVSLRNSRNIVKASVIRNKRMLLKVDCQLSSSPIDLPEVPRNPVLLYQVIPRPDKPGPLFRRVISREVPVFGQEKVVKRYGKASLKLYKSEKDPISDLEPLRIFGATYSISYYKSQWGKVLATLENNLQDT